MLFVLLHIGGKSFAMSYEEEIYKLYLKNKELDEKLLEKLTFELSDFQPLLDGQNAKCILKGSNGRPWFFKTEESSRRLDTMYNWFLLCGENKPACYNITLPINGELVKGSIQEFIFDARTLDNISIPKLSKKQIEFIQRQQIINWLICSEETFDCDPGQFLIKNNKIINVEKSRGFSVDYLPESLIGNFNNSLNMEHNYYNIFWKAYVNKEIDVDFNKSFELIDYIQSLDDSFIKGVFKFNVPEELFTSLLIKRKHRLRDDFEEYYCYLANLRGDVFNVPMARGPFNFLKMVFKKFKKVICKKQVILNRLQSNKNCPQKNIEAVLSTRVREVVRKYGFPDVYYRDNIINMKKELNGLRETLGNLDEKIALYLFLSRLKRIEYGLTEENFFEFGTVATYAPKTIDADIIEANLRVENYQQKGFFIDTFAEFVKSDLDASAHILYILTTCFTFGQPQEAINRCQLGNKYDKEIMQVLDILNIRCQDRNSIPRIIERLNKLDNNSGWKNFFLSFFYYQEAFWHSERNFKKNAISELEKTIKLTRDKKLLYISYLFLGYLYEHNNECFRFGKGFNLDLAINAYQKAAEINPDSLSVHLNLYTLYLIKGEPDKVWHHFNCIKKIDAQYATENFYLEQGFYKKIEKFKKSDQIEMLKTCSLNAEQHYILSLIFSLKQNQSLAKKHLDEAKRKGYFKNEN